MAYDMKKFFETRFGPTELAIIHSVFNEWTERANVKKDSPEAELAAAIVFNLFREGNDTVPALREAVSQHRGLDELRHDLI